MTSCARCGRDLPEAAAYCPGCGNAVAAAGAGPVWPPRAPSAAPSSGSAPWPTPAPAYAPPAQAHAPALPAYAPASPAPTGRAPPSDVIAIAGLLLNILVWPGLGSLIAGENVGWAQGFLFLFGIILTITIIGMVIGIPLMIGMWIWGIVTGVQLIQASQARRA